MKKLLLLFALFTSPLSAVTVILKVTDAVNQKIQSFSKNNLNRTNRGSYVEEFLKIQLSLNESKVSIKIDPDREPEANYSEDVTVDELEDSGLSITFNHEKISGPLTIKLLEKTTEDEEDQSLPKIKIKFKNVNSIIHRIVDYSNDRGFHIKKTEK